jgi:predicted nucleotidyltransferase
MAVDVKAVMKVVEQYIADVKNVFPIHTAYLYGSYANGNPQWDSDVDLCFFLHGNIPEASPAELPIGVALLGMTRKYDPRICIDPRVFPASELHNDNPFVKEIVRTGREVGKFPE